MELAALSVVGTFILIMLSSTIIGWWYSRSKADWRDTEAYYAERERRLRSFRETHLGAALFAGLVIGSFNAWWLADTPVPALLALLISGALWPLTTYRWRPAVDRMRMYEKQSMLNLWFSLKWGALIGILLSIVLWAGFIPLAAALVVATVTWMALFPM